MASLLDKQLIFVTGKGGVGKSTTTAALALMAARLGKRVLICELDAETSMERMFGVQDVGFEPTEVSTRVWAANIRRAEALGAFITRAVPGGRIARAILQNRVASVLFDAAPSVMETVILDQVALHATASPKRFDLVVVDMPASGHALHWMNVPRNMADLISVGDLSKRIRRLAEIIEDPKRSEIVLVTLPEEMPVNETLELYERMSTTIGTPVEAIVVNGIRPALEQEEERQTVAELRDLAGSDEDQAAIDRILDGLDLLSFWSREDHTHAGRLAEETEATLVEVPFIFRKGTDVDLVRSISRSLEAELVGESG